MMIPRGNIIASQFGEALDNAISAWPESLWDAANDPTAYWYTAYHALFWLDLYLYGAGEGFVPPAPFTLAEADLNGLLPERIYTTDELRTYLDHSRQKLQNTLNGLTDEKASQRCTFGWGQVSVAVLLLYNMRYVQQYASQLSLIIGQQVASVPSWVGKARTQ
jgi:hypothetical protein